MIKNGKKMKIITIALPFIYVDAIDILCSAGLYPSRSEAIRQAILYTLRKDLKLMNDLQISNFDKKINELGEILFAEID